MAKAIYLLSLLLFYQNLASAQIEHSKSLILELDTVIRNPNLITESFLRFSIVNIGSDTAWLKRDMPGTDYLVNSEDSLGPYFDVNFEIKRLPKNAKLSGGYYGIPWYNVGVHDSLRWNLPDSLTRNPEPDIKKGERYYWIPPNGSLRLTTFFATKGVNDAISRQLTKKQQDKLIVSISFAWRIEKAPYTVLIKSKPSKLAKELIIPPEKSN